MRNAVAEVTQVRPQLIPNASEDRHAFFVRADKRGGRIVNAMVKLFCSAKEYRAGFAGLVAYSDNVIEPLALEFINVL